MTSGISTGLRLATWTTAGVIALATAAGTATAVTSHHDGGDGGSSNRGRGGPEGPGGPDGHGRGGPQALPRPVVHAVATVKTKSGTFRTFKLQRGTVSEITEESLTVTSADEYAATYVLSSSTTYFKKGAKATAADIADGNMVQVTAKKVGGHFTAVRVFDGKPPRHHDEPEPGDS